MAKLFRVTFLVVMLACLIIAPSGGVSAQSESLSWKRLRIQQASRVVLIQGAEHKLWVDGKEHLPKTKERAPRIIDFPAPVSPVIDVNPEVFPEKITWEKRTPKKQIESFGISGDLLYEPQWISPNFIPYMQTAMFIDPSGRGSDETAICIASFVNGYVIVHELLGLQGGYEEALLKKIAKLAYQYDINLIRVEANFGDAMYCNLLRPVVSEICGQVAIEDFKVTGNKEQRIIRVLEPIMAVHKLIFNTKAIKNQENQKQITRITERRGSLKHDDRVDILASAVAASVEVLRLIPAVPELLSVTVTSAAASVTVGSVTTPPVL